MLNNKKISAKTYVKDSLEKERIDTINKTDVLNFPTMKPLDK